MRHSTRRRGVSKLYLIVGCVIGVILLGIALKLFGTRANPEDHRTRETMDANRIENVAPNQGPQRTGSSENHATDGRTVETD